MKGLESIKKKLVELRKFANDIDGEIVRLSFDPADPADIERACIEMESVIDNGAARYSRNDHVQELTESLKAKYREQLLDTASRMRLGGSSEL